MLGGAHFNKKVAFPTAARAKKPAMASTVEGEREGSAQELLRQVCLELCGLQGRALQCSVGKPVAPLAEGVLGKEFQTNILAKNVVVEDKLNNNIGFEYLCRQGLKMVKLYECL